MGSSSQPLGWAIAGSLLPLLIAPPSHAQLTKVTHITVVPLADSVQVVFEAADTNRLQIFQSRTATALIVDIPGAQLALPPALPFRRRYSRGPVTEIRVEQLTETTVRLTLVSATADLPEIFQVATDESLTLEVFPPGALATTPDSLATDPLALEANNLQLIVTAPAPPRYEPLREGTRTGADLLETPQSIQSVNQAVVEDQGGVGVGSALRNVSGVSTGRLGAGDRGSFPIIRGFESTSLLRNGLRDDTLRFGATINNIERVEILKGPSSVLFGSGDLGGVVNLVTERPLDSPRYELGVTVGSDALVRTQGDFTGPLDDTSDLAYRLNWVYESGGSFQDFAETDFFFIAPTFQFINTERTSLVVDLEYSRFRSWGVGPGLPAVPAIGLANNSLVDRAGAAITPASLAAAGTLNLRTNIGEPTVTAGETTLTRVGYQLSHRFSDTWRFDNQFLASFQQTPYERLIAGVNYVQVGGQVNFNALRRLYLENPSSREGYTTNANFIGNFDLFGLSQTLLLGAEWSYEVERDTLTLQIPFPNQFNVFSPNYNPQSLFAFGPGAPAADSLTKTQTIGLYGQTQINILDNLILVLGGRFDIAEQFFRDTANVANPNPIETDDTAFSPRFGLVFQPSESWSIYASYAESFKPTIGRGVSGDLFSPELGNQFEVGLKVSLFGDRLLATLAYYDLTRTNVLTQDPGNPGFQIQVGEQNSRGFEFDLVGEILPGWDIIASYAYTDARVVRDNVFIPGIRLPNVPDHAASLWTTYRISSGDLAGLGFGLGINLVGTRNGDLRSPFEIPSYTRTDAALFYERGGFRAQFNVQNLFNTRYFEGARDQFRVVPGQPLTVIGSLTWTF